MNYPNFPALFPIKRSDFTLFTPSAFSWFDRLMALTDTDPGYGPWGDCWLWIGQVSPKGYGKIQYLTNGHRRCDNRIKLPKTSKSIAIRVHRLSYLIHIGPIPEGKMICHRCDVPRCVNPAHLYAGTAKQNFDESYKKGRHSFVQVHQDWAELKKDVQLCAAMKRMKNFRKSLAKKLKRQKLFKPE